MELLNLTLAQLLGLLVPAAALVTVLYFYDRSRRRVVVSTTRFFPPRMAPPVARRQHKLQQPWSWLLQLLALILLLLAIADFRFSLSGEPRNHVILVDASAGMRGTARAGGLLMDAARESAKQYLRALPARDLAMVVRLDGAPVPMTAFTADRATLVQAIDGLQSGWTAADIPRALDIARAALSWSGDSAPERAGEVAVISPGLTASADVDPIPAGLQRVRWISVEPGGADRWIAGLRAERDAEQTESWNVVADVGHDGLQTADLVVEFRFAGQALGAKRVRAPAGATRQLTFRMTTARAGTLEAAVRGDDRNSANDRAQLQFPAADKFPVSIVTARPGRFNDLLGASRYLVTSYVSPGQSPSAGAALVIYDGQPPQQWPAAPAVVIGGAEAGAGLSSPSAQSVTRWRLGHPLTAGLEGQPLELPASYVYTPTEGQTAIAESGQAVLALLDDSAEQPRLWVGWDISASDIAGDPVTPIFFANILNYFLPGSFPPDSLHALPPGSVELAMTPVQALTARVVDEQGAPLASFPRGAGLQFFRAQPAQLRVLIPGGTRRVSLTLPAPPGVAWQPPETILRGIPPAAGGSGGSGALWQWLALLAAGLLVADWFLFGRPHALHRSSYSAPPPQAPPSAPTETPERELAGVGR